MAVSHLHMDEERLDTHYVFLNQPSATGLILQKKKRMIVLFQRRNLFFPPKTKYVMQMLTNPSLKMSVEHTIH